jgi:hypothetical protein
MIGLQAPEGELHYVNYVWHSHKTAKSSWKVKPQPKIFKVVVDEDGNIFVDGVKQDFTVVNVREQMEIAADMLITNNLAMPKPINPKEPFNDFASPCNFCTFKVACEKLDSRLLKDHTEFISLCSTLAKGENHGDSISVP